MVKSKQTHNEGPHLFLSRPDLHHRYHELLKEARVWNNSGQYWLGRESEILAEQLLNGKEEAATKIVRSEQLFQKTKRML